jgi:DNA-directed RNA polymerase sigma subunit (sigma70/sigma32)
MNTQGQEYWQPIEKINPDKVADTLSLSPLQVVLRKECLKKAFKEMSKLPHRDVEIVMMRNYEGKTLEEIRYDVLNPKTGKPVSRERVRQLGDRALGKVRAALIEDGYGLE